MDSRFAATLLRTWVALLLAGLPLAVWLLVPQLMRSRVEWIPGLAMLGAAGLLTLVAVGVIAAPTVSAAAAPTLGWQPRTARRAVRDLIQRDRRAWWRVLAEFLGWYALSQLAGGYIGWLMPSIWRAGADDPERTWVLHYPNYAVQALTIYAVICFGFAWYATRIRSLSIGAGVGLGAASSPR